MRIPGWHMETLVWMNFMDYTANLKCGYSGKDIKELFRLIVEVADFRRSAWYPLLDYAQIASFRKMPPVAVTSPRIMLSVFNRDDCHVFFLFITYGRRGVMKRCISWNPLFPEYSFETLFHRGESYTIFINFFT